MQHQGETMQHQGNHQNTTRQELGNNKIAFGKQEHKWQTGKHEQRHVNNEWTTKEARANHFTIKVIVNL